MSDEPTDRELERLARKGDDGVKDMPDCLRGLRLMRWRWELFHERPYPED